jgi:acetyl/propionyl-CoA carboxylase alpha subunit
VDDGFEEGMDIPIYYDPMIAKLITHGKNREEAIQRMVRAISDYQISGVQTTLDFCKWAIQHDAFTSGNFDTHFVKHYFTPDVLKVENAAAEEIAAIVAGLAWEENHHNADKVELSNDHGASNWVRNRS